MFENPHCPIARRRRGGGRSRHRGTIEGGILLDGCRRFLIPPYCKVQYELFCDNGYVVLLDEIWGLCYNDALILMEFSFS